MGVILVGVTWRVWAVLVCLQVSVAYADVVNNLQELQDSSRKNEDGDVNNSEIEARGKKKKLKYLLAFLIGVIVIKGLFIPIALKTVTLLAGKAFLLSKLSLILSAILGLRSIASAGWNRMGDSMMIMKDRGEVTEMYHPPEYHPAEYHPVPTEAMYHKISADQHWSRKMKDK